jgi:hypothetical protein
MSLMLEALRMRQPLPTWPQVKPQAGSRRGTQRLQWPAGLPGYGDGATWPPCEQHPHDPRSDEAPEHAATLDALSDVVSLLEQARVEVALKDDWTAAAAALVREAIEALLALEVES